MKKIFLTSGLVLCMACPAFAVNDGVANIGVTTDQSGAVTGTASANCVEDPTLETNENGKYVNFTALWTPNNGTINLVNNSSYTQQACTNNTTVTHSSTDGNWNSIFTAANPDTLYTTYGVGVYGTSARSSAITSLTSSPTLKGYTFDGYFDGTGANRTQYIYGLSDACTAGQDAGCTTTIANGDFVADTNRSGHTLLDQYISASGGTGTLYAHWTPNTYKIEYECGAYTAAGASEPTEVAVKQVNNVPVSLAQTVTYDDCYEVQSVNNFCVAPAGYTFGGWDCKKDLPDVSPTLPASGDTTGYPSGTSVLTLYESGIGGTWLREGDVTCTAIWRANSINLTWNVNGGTPGATAGSSSCIYDTAITTMPSAPTKTGYTFAGWDVTSVTNAAPSND